jgi:hypothetical protein
MQQGDVVTASPGTAVPRILLTDTTRWATPARIAIDLTKAGCAVSAVCPTEGHPLLATGVVKHMFPYSGLRPLKSLEHAINATEPQIIVPSDDRGVNHLHELHAYARDLGASGAKLADLIEYSLGAPESYPIVSARCELLTIAREEGVRIPDTKHLKSADDLESWQAAGHPLPWVLKGDGTFGGKGVKIADTPALARKHFAEISSMFGAIRAIKRAMVNRDPFWLRPWLQNHQPAILVQSHVKGRPANCAFVCWKGEVLAGIAVEVVASEGTTGPAEIVRVVDNPEMSLAAERLARRLNLSGFFGLDFMIENSSGATYMIEMNPRCTPLTHLQLGKGRDMIEALAAQLSGRPSQATTPITLNDLIAYFPQSHQCKSEFLRSSFQDIPHGEPALVEDLLRPWPGRSFLYQVLAKVTGFAAALRARKSPQAGLPPT